MSQDNCIACGECCKKHWIVKLTSKREKERFPHVSYSHDYMWTDLCPFFKNGKCTTHDDKPQKCKEYYCEKY